MPTAFLSLGSNLGDRAVNLSAALNLLDRDGIDVTGVSRFYESVHMGQTPEPVPDYVNCVARIETTLSAEALLNRTQRIERELGREPTFRWGPRIIDIDIILYDEVTTESERLTIPHPRFRERAFVLLPLAELEPNLVLPDGTKLSALMNEPAIKAQRIHALTAPSTRVA